MLLHFGAIEFRSYSILVLLYFGAAVYYSVYSNRVNAEQTKEGGTFLRRLLICSACDVLHIIGNYHYTTAIDQQWETITPI